MRVTISEYPKVLSHLAQELEKWQYETVSRKVSLYFDYMTQLEKAIEALTRNEDKK